MNNKTIKNVFTMLTLRLIKILLDFSSRLVPMLVIVLAALKLTKIIELEWKYVIVCIIVEAILIIFSLIFDSLFFKNKKAETSTTEESNDNTTASENSKKFPILNTVAVFFGFLTLVFIFLKIFKAVTWTWLWVLSPLWLSTALIISILIIAVIVFIISSIVKRGKERNENMDDSKNTENNSKD